MKTHVRRFGTRLALFLLVFVASTLLLVAYPGYLFVKAGEHLTVDQVLERQRSDDGFLYGPAYSNKQVLYKTRFANSSDCTVLALGTSRIMQFRDHFFTARFCNAGGGITRIGHVLPFLERLSEDRRPELLLLSLDQNFFNAEWDDGTQERYEDLLDEEKSLEIFRQSMVSIYADVLEGKIDPGRVRAADDAIGLNAIMNGNGFLKDGSYQHLAAHEMNSILNESHWDYELQQSMRLIDKGTGIYAHGTDISDRSVRETEAILAELDRRGIRLIAFLPPYADTVWERLQTEHDDYAYLPKILPAIRPLFERYGAELYDYSDIAAIGARHCEVTDGFHGSEKAYLRLLIDLQSRSPLMRSYVDPEALRVKLARSDGCVLTDRTEPGKAEFAVQTTQEASKSFKEGVGFTREMLIRAVTSQ